MDLDKNLVLSLVCLVVACVSCGGGAQTKQIRTQASPSATDLSSYSDMLSALEEPNLCEPDSSGIESYRFLWVRTFHPIVVIRISIHSDADARAMYKATTGPGGYDYGTLAEKSSRDLAIEEADGDIDTVELLVEALREMTESQFWNLPYVIDDGTLILDGATWMIEGRKDGDCHVVSRQSPSSDTPFRQLCEWFLQLSGKRFDDFEVY